MARITEREAGRTRQGRSGRYREFTHDPGTVPGSGFTRVTRGPSDGGDLTGLRAMYRTRALTIINRSSALLKVTVNNSDPFFIEAASTATVDAFGNQLGEIESVEDLPEGPDIFRYTITPADGSEIATDNSGQTNVPVVERCLQAQLNRRHRRER